MIEHQTINGRRATVAYLGEDFSPVDRGQESMVKIIFEDGEVVFAVPDKNGGEE
jgi:hypothetical protein